ncbi:hypothetical protein PITCH_A1860007 [uncultured Desulfobacterium sp.]|uniref:PAS domain S-box protein n=1 Tax=uncultured Desulfobacterium sp. TaxID=201089 RepID=A0A445MVM5_9BACT|nr:hypothetical protein PITCH_A1860007 [uncultured Desulfobacterium sp.]
MDLKATYVSPSVQKVRGYTADETMNQSLEEIFTPDSFTAAKTIIEKAFKELANGNKEKAEETFVAELEQNCKDGSTIWAEIKANFILDSKGQPAGIIGITRDISDRKRAEDTLRKSEEAYRNLFNSIPDPIAIFQDDFTVIRNSAYERIFGYTPEEIENDIGTFGLLKNSKDKKIAHKRIAARLAGKGISPMIHYVDILNREGQTISCEVSDAIIQYAGRVANLLIFRDISERKKAESAIKEKQAELDHKNKTLEEMNAALRVLLKQRDEDKIYVEQNVLSNVQKLVIPFLNKLTETKLDLKQASYVNIVESNLNEIISPFSRRFSAENLRLTRTELQIANLIKQGKESKAIAELLNLSIPTVETHRRNIRKKFGLKSRHQSLYTHLSELFNE